jgi:MtaA/CmuA family methyltransferase
MMTGRERILATLSGERRDHLALMPITMMFAADTAGVSYGDYARDHQVLAHAQMVTAGKYGFDYVSAISDPAREAADLGAVVEYFPDQPPAIIEERALLLDKTMLARLQLPSMEPPGRMHDRLRAVETLAREAGGELAVEGWVEGPCAMASDLRGINNLMLDFFDDPGFVDDLFEFVVAMEIAFAKAQIAAGATIIGIGDAASSLVGPRLYKRFVLPYEQRLIKGIKDAGGLTRLHICGNTRKILDGMGQSGADLIDLDYPSPVAEARAQTTPTQPLLGNLDPVRVVRDGDPESVAAAIAQCHREAGDAFIVGAGCELARGTPEANVRALADYAKGHA